MNKREFFRHGREIQLEPLHYTMCGLDDIYLLNGFERKKTAHGDGVTVSAIDGLHKAIGFALITDRKTLTPKELRFLRKEMSLTQAELGGALRLSGQQVARWEKAECEISGPAETLLRLLYVITLAPAKHRAKILDKLMEKLGAMSKQDETKTTKLVFRETELGWSGSQAANCHSHAIAM